MSGRNGHTPLAVRRDCESVAHQAMMDLSTGLHDLAESGGPIHARNMGKALKVRDDAARAAARSIVASVTRAITDARTKGKPLPGAMGSVVCRWIVEIFDELTERMVFRLDGEGQSIMSAPRKWEELTAGDTDLKQHVREPDRKKGLAILAASRTFVEGLSGFALAEIRNAKYRLSGRAEAAADLEPSEPTIDQSRPLVGKKEICNALKRDPDDWKWLVRLSRITGGPLHGGRKGTKRIVYESTLRKWFLAAAEKRNELTDATGASPREFIGERSSGTSAKPGTEIMGGSGNYVPVKKRRSDRGKKRNPEHS